MDYSDRTAAVGGNNTDTDYDDMDTASEYYCCDCSCYYCGGHPYHHWILHEVDVDTDNIVGDGAGAGVQRQRIVVVASDAAAAAADVTTTTTNEPITLLRHC